MTWIGVKEFLEIMLKEKRIRKLNISDSSNSFYFRMKGCSHMIRISDHWNPSTGNGKINYVFTNQDEAITFIRTNLWKSL